jgi:uncharacterized membrane protein (UPF0127 family)
MERRTDFRHNIDWLSTNWCRMHASSRVAHRAALFASMLLAFLLAAPSSSEADMRHDTLTLVTATGNKNIDVEIAATSAEQMKGLMFRKSLPDTSGMLFPYDPPRELTMWMKNTYIPLDMVFIRPDGVVHRIEERTEPFSEAVIYSRGDMAAVLELAGGAAERLGLKPGDRVDYPLFKKAK